MTAYNIKHVDADNVKTVVVSSGPTSDDLIDGLNDVPDRSKPVRTFLQLTENSPALPVLITSIGYQPETGGAVLTVIPDLSDAAADAIAAQGIFPR